MDDPRFAEALDILRLDEEFGDARTVGEKALHLVHGALRSAWEKAGCRVRIDKGRTGTSAPPSCPVKSWMDEECREARRAMMQARRRGQVSYRHLRNVYRVTRDAKRVAWNKEWGVFWTVRWKVDPGEVWRHLKSLMGRSGGDPCLAEVDRIIRHFENVGRPPGDPQFCEDCLTQAQRRVEEMVSTQGVPVRQDVTTKEAEQAYRQLRKVSKGLDGLGQEVVGPALDVLLPVVARLFSHLLTYAVAPRDWSLAIIALIKKSGPSNTDLDNFRAVHLLCFVYKWYTAVLRGRILPAVSSNLPDFNRGFTCEGTCAQAVLALTTVLEREVRVRTECFVCFVDIRKAFPRVRRELLWKRMLEVGCPVYLVRAVMALYEETRATVRTPEGYTPIFLIEQGTREGCILSPLLFLIFFASSLEHMRTVELADGAVMLGTMVAFIILFADDVALIARSIEDLQKLLDAWGRFCDCSHEQVAVNKTKALCVRSADSSIRLVEGRLLRRVRHENRSGVACMLRRTLRRGGGSTVFAWEPLSLMYRDSPVEWVSTFKYLGSTVAETDIQHMHMPRDIALSNARKADGIVKSVAGSTVVFPSHRLVFLHQSLSSSLATVNAVAWAPRVYSSVEWRQGEACFYAWILGSSRGRAAAFRWRWDALFQLPSESSIVLVAVARIIHQMHAAPVDSFMGGLQAELWSESRAHPGAWMCGALRWWAWCFDLYTGGSAHALDGGGVWSCAIDG